MQTAPEQIDALALLGLIRGTLGHHGEAVALIEQAVARDPQSSLFRFHLGSVLMNAQKLPEAVAAFRRAIAMKPAFAPAHYNLANALRAQGDWTGAIAAYRATIQRDPQAGGGV